jgi:hypothetical protein
MYARLVATAPLGRRDRRALAERLAVARMRLAREALAGRRYAEGARLVARATGDSPRLVASRIRSRLR